MKPPLFIRLFIRPLTGEEQKALNAGLRSSNAFALRRCQILLASSRGQRPSEIAHNLGCATQTVRNAINDFDTSGLECLKPGSSRPKTVKPIFDDAKAEALRTLLHKSPRAFGKTTSIWTLGLAAEVCLQEGVTERLVTGKHRAHSSGSEATGSRLAAGQALDYLTRPRIRAQKKRRDHLIVRATERSVEGWIVGYADEVWWSRRSRLAQPRMHAWTEQGQPLRLQEFDADADKADTDPKALCCYGLLRGDTARVIAIYG